MAEKLTISHIERPGLPWHKPEQQLTECGLIAASFPTISREEARSRLKEWGQMRTQMTCCATCFDTASRWATWEYDPLDAIERSINLDRRGGGWRAFHKGLEPGDAAPNSPFRAELRAIAILIERHSAEFDGILIGLGEVVDLAEKRRERIEKQRQERKERRSPKW